MQLHEYQRQAVEYIKTHSEAAIFLDCGLGKTVIALTAISEIKPAKTLIIAPLRVARDVWSAEIAKWEHLHHLTYSIAVGSVKQRTEALRKQADIYIINRENVDWLIRKSGVPFNYEMVVVDELSSFKSYKATRFKSLLKVRHKIKRIVGLTGTPCSNGLMDLFAEFKLLDMGQRLGKYITHYRNTFFTPDKKGYDQVVYSYKLKPNADKEIYDSISDITLGINRADYLKMPDLVFNNVYVELTKAERKQYQNFRAEYVLMWQDVEVTASNAAVLINKLVQLANGEVYTKTQDSIKIHDHKLDALEDLIEAANGKPVLVAYWFKHDLRRIQERFPEAIQLNNADSFKQWNAGEIPVALIHPASAGHGLNLQEGGATLIWFGLTWSLELYQQTIARLWRQGQKETVVVHHIITRQTVDEHILRALNSKNTTQTALLTAIKTALND